MCDELAWVEKKGVCESTSVDQKEGKRQRGIRNNTCFVTFIIAANLALVSLVTQLLNRDRQIAHKCVILPRKVSLSFVVLHHSMVSGVDWQGTGEVIISVNETYFGSRVQHENTSRL